MNRRNILIGLGVVAAGVAAGAGYWLSSSKGPQQAASGSAAPAGKPITLATGGEMPIFDDDRILGDAGAPVTILEYASLTCPHCAAFHKETLAQVKAEWIDTGRARLVFRHYPLDQLALRAAAVTECIQDEAFFGFVDVLFENQQKWAGSQDPMKVLQQYAALAGIGAADFEACVSDEAAITRILEVQTDGRDTYSVASTPTFVINGTPVTGARSYDDFKGFLESAAAKAS